MKKKNKFGLISRAILCIILSISMIAPSLTSFAVESGGTDAATDDYGIAEGIGKNVNGLNAISGMAVAVSLMKVDNTTEPYKDAITSHNISSTNTWSEMGVSIVDNYLNKYPTYMLQQDTLSNSAVMRQTIRQLYTAQKADTATLEIEYDFECTKGSGDSGSFLDQAVFPTGMSGASKKVTIPNLTWEKAATLFDGNTVVQWKDTNIVITENTTNRYYAKVTLIMADGTRVRFNPKGKVLFHCKYGVRQVFM